MPTSAPSDVLGDRYEVRELIAAGGMAEVYRGHDRRLDRTVAVKVLAPRSHDEAARERFLAEARMLAGLSHPHLVTVLDAGVTDDRPWLVMEHVPGPNLAGELARGPLSPGEAVRVAAELAGALARVHEHGIVHRDVKPANVLLGEGRVRLTDFGVARLVEGGAALTRTGTTVGTAAYLAPEQLRGQAVSGAADVFALGLVLLECLTGTRAYPGPETEAALARLDHAPAVPDALPGDLRTLLVEMTAARADLRPSAAETAERLRALAPGVAGSVGTDAPPAETKVLHLAPAEGALTAPAPTPSWTPPAPPGPPAPPAVARAAALAGALRDGMRDRARAGVGAIPAHLRPVVAVVAALLVLIVLAALVGGSGGPAGSGAGSGGTDPSGGQGTVRRVPAGTPAGLRDPLQRLHDAVAGR